MVLVLAPLEVEYITIFPSFLGRKEKIRLLLS